MKTPMITVRFDEDDRYSWSSITSFFSGEILEAKVTEFDDGKMTEEFYEEGILARRLQLDNKEDSQTSWQSIETYYDHGEAVAKVTRYDNGVVDERSYVNGELYQHFSTDEGNARVWSSIERHFDEAGSLIGRQTNFDNGVVKGEMFEDGLRVYTLQRDDSEQGAAKTWEQIDTYYDDNGELAGRITAYDNGVQREEQFDAGQRVTMTETDASFDGEAKNWERVDTYYDEDGAPAGKYIVYDNGTVSETSYVEGVRSQMVQSDNSEGGEAAAWSQIETYYDETGAKAERFTVYDDGTTKQDSFINGVRSVTIQQDFGMGYDDDGAKSWEQIITVFDEEGQREGRVVIHDNGSVKGTAYHDNGKKSITFSSDAQDGLGGLYSWSDRASFFDEDGLLFQKAQLNDDGSGFVSDYEGGVLVETRYYTDENGTGWFPLLEPPAYVGDSVAAEVDPGYSGDYVAYHDGF